MSSNPRPAGAINHRWTLTLRAVTGETITFNGQLPIQSGGSGAGARQHILDHITGQNPVLADAEVLGFVMVPDRS
jgi:hypothetical protein